MNIGRMEDLVSCKICAQVYDSLQFIPKILKCGHTFCSPCLIKLLQEENPRCPNCRIQLKEIESSLPVNYNTLNTVDIYKFNCFPQRKMDIATEVAKRKDIVLKKKTQMTLNVKILDKCLEKLEELTVSQSERIDAVNAIKILDEIDEDLKKTDVVRSDDINIKLVVTITFYDKIFTSFE
ncbi:E3 ubiquitin-protein ligase TRIM32 [Armadillidium nasatum]|uniref:E3 ubiquitin-protein ligase TRIM32 n=1 Tax=Armadillidium nasatum TaxID=96803 RepID=A0A5N5T0R1_9CRUS|nr:E3 ubiquitin-protein ligase TRIM32 [Armadillidium nasatum]